jgi:hypothetical protein
VNTRSEQSTAAVPTRSVHVWQSWRTRMGTCVVKLGKALVAQRRCTPEGGTCVAELRDKKACFQCVESIGAHQNSNGGWGVDGG